MALAFLSRRSLLAAAPTALAGLAATASPALAQATWKTYSRPDLGYAIDMPGDPTVTRESVDTAIGAVVVHAAVLELGGRAAMMMMSNDYGRTGDADKLLDGAVNGVVGDKILVSQARITAVGAPGRDLIIQARDRSSQISARLILSGSRLFQIMHLGPPGPQLPADYIRARDSFRLVPIAS